MQDACSWAGNITRKHGVCVMPFGIMSVCVLIWSGKEKAVLSIPSGPCLQYHSLCRLVPNASVLLLCIKGGVPRISVGASVNKNVYPCGWRICGKYYSTWVCLGEAVSW